MPLLCTASPFGNFAYQTGDGNYGEAAISLAGDVAFFTGLGAAAKGVQAGRAATLYRVSVATESTVAGVRSTQGIYRFSQGNNEEGVALVGEATMRLLGIGVGEGLRRRAAAARPAADPTSPTPGRHTSGLPDTPPQDPPKAKQQVVEVLPGSGSNSPHISGHGSVNGTAIGSGTNGVTGVSSPQLPIGGGSQRLPAHRMPQPDVPVTRQPTRNTCVPASLDMLLAHHFPNRQWTLIERLRQMRPDGLTPSDMTAFISENIIELGMRVGRGELADALKSGQPFIAILSQGSDVGHAVLVQGVREFNGIKYVLDPLEGAYLEMLHIFDARLFRDESLLPFPTIWAVP